MSEISQAERTAMESVESPVPWCLLSTKEQQIVQKHWLAASDYYTATGPNSYWAKAGLDYKRWLEQSEERERTLQSGLIDALKILHVLTAGLASEENAQPDHGPGEPSDAQGLRGQLVEMAQLALSVLEAERARTGVDEWDESDARCLLHNRAEDALRECESNG